MISFIKVIILILLIFLSVYFFKKKKIYKQNKIKFSERLNRKILDTKN
jgi:regulatory protein YycI of two-component signal transduction system YycFG